MKELFKRIKGLMIVFGSLLMAAGIIIFVISVIQVNQLALILSIVAAVCLFIIGGFTIFATLMFGNRVFYSSNLNYAALVIALGVLFCIDTALLESFSILYIGIILIVFGGIAVLRCIFALFSHESNKKWILGYVLFAAVGLSLGIVTVIFRTEAVLKMIIYIVLALFLIGVGVFNIVGGIKLLNAKHPEAVNGKEEEKK